MVVCKYFLNGNCRYGDNCKNQHIYENPRTQNQSVLRKVTDVNVLIKAVHNDVDKSEKGKQWPLTCYGPFQYKPCLPGFEDKSFEELRYEMIQAERTGTIEQYKQQLMQLLQEIRMKMHMLLNPSPEIVNCISNLYNTNPAEANIFKTQSGASTNNFGGGGQTGTASNFTFTLPQENKNVFGGNTGSIFGQNTTNTGSIFGQNTTNTGSIFSQNPMFAQTPVNTGPIYNQNQNAPSSIFAQSQNATSSSNSIFGQSPMASGTVMNQNQANPGSIFSQNVTSPIFAQSQTPNIFQTETQPQNQYPFQKQPETTSTNVFSNQMPTNPTNSIFGGSVPTSILHSANVPVTSRQMNFSNTIPYPQTFKNDPTNYSKIDDLNETDLIQFQSLNFEFGKIPEKPPTIELCV